MGFLIDNNPTLKYLRDGELHKYTGERTVDGFVEFAEKMNGEAIQEITTKYVLSKFQMKKDVTYIYGPGKETEGFEKKNAYQVYSDVAYKLQADEYFAVAIEHEMQEKAVKKLKSKSYIARLERGEAPQFFTGEMTEDAIINWIDDTKHPTVIQLDAKNFYNSLKEIIK